jgi:hypothetical protein
MKRILATLTGIAFALLLITSANPASANISAYGWDRGTIVLNNMTSTYNSTINTEWNAEVAYYNSQIGVTWHLVQGTCQPNMPCIEMYSGASGNTGWVGLTTYAYHGCLSPNAFCRYNGTTSLTYHTTIQFNTYYAWTAQGAKNAFCHELGHALGELQHASGSTCMQATANDSSNYSALSATEISELQTRYNGMAY